MTCFGSAVRSSVLMKNAIKPSYNLQQKRPFWALLNSIFNRYDESRVKDVGPDRACAEWLIRCGAGVKWNQDTEWFRDYNSLPSLDKARSYTISEIDGTDSAVMNIGFRFFRGLKHCRKIIFHRASYLEDDALVQLGVLQHCLKDLQISACGNVSEQGIMALAPLVKLEKLLLYDLPLVRDRERCVQFLSNVLPLCKVSFPYAQASEDKRQHPSDPKKSP